ncbi:MAG: nitrate reductase [Acidobacteria bacterium]|nr:nitrate reductase [Acidobacteriota bacterium]
MKSLARILGFDTLGDSYAYRDDPVLGYTSARRSAERWVKSTCGYCSVGCGLELGVRGREIVAVKGWDKHPVSLGKLCPKGLSEHQMISAPNRAKYPLLRGRGGKLAHVGWDEAIGTLVDRFTAVQKQNGPGALGVISTGQLLTEEFYALGKLIQLGFGTRNYCGNTTLCMASAVSGYKRSFGSDGPPGAYEDFRVADVTLLIGANIADNHPILCQHVEANKAGFLIVADPRVTKTAMMASLHLPLKPRSDIALLNGMAHVLFREGLVREDFAAAHANGLEELRSFILARYPVERAAALTGLSAETIADVARRYGRARAGMIAWTMGVNHSTQGAETVSAIANLSLLTGHIGRPGASPFSITGQCNAMGTREAGFTSSLPGYRKFEKKEDREELAALWGIEPARIPDARGLAYPDIINAAADGEVRAMWIIATNPAVSYPNQEQLRRAFRSLDFLVVQDGFHPTPTSEYAHLVLPAAIWGEKEGTFTNSERRAGKVNSAVPPPGEARSDFDIFLAVADRLGRRDELFPGWFKPVDAFNEWRRVSRGRLCDYSGMTYETIEAEGGLQWPYSDGFHGSPASRLYSTARFQFEDGRARLFTVDCEPFPDQPDDVFPMILNTGRTVEHWHTRTKTAQVAILERMAPNAWLEMNSSDARALTLSSHDRVDIVSRRGRVRDVELRVTEITAPGQVFMPFHFFETNGNEVTQDAFDPISREPNFKQCAVRVERSARKQGNTLHGTD